jgi:hypothetical protein
MGNRALAHPCEFCGAQTRNPRFCSNACHIKGTQEVRSAKLRKPRGICPVCGKQDVMRGARTCSRACADVLRSASHTPPPCRRCGSTERKKGRNDNKGPYCSRSCYMEDRYQRTGSFAKWMAGWQSGEISGTLSDGRPDWRIRQALVLLRGQRCEECGWNKVNPVSGRVPLHVDHATGDRSRNRPEDVRLLCPNCHSLTTNYQHLNNPAVNPVRVKQNRRYREVWLDSIPSPTRAATGRRVEQQPVRKN